MSIPCPLCFSKNTRIAYRQNNMPVGIFCPGSNIDLTVSICFQCDFMFQSSAYKKEYDAISQRMYANYTLFESAPFPKRDPSLQDAIDYLSPYCRNTLDFSVLEIGSNRGDFLFLLKERFSQIDIMGCEPQGTIVCHVPTTRACFDPILFKKRYDVIVLRHVLEHIKNPHSFLKGLWAVLKEDGHIFVEVPNESYALEKKLEDFTPDHVSFFTKETLIRLFNGYGPLTLKESRNLMVIFKKTVKASEKPMRTFPLKKIESFTSATKGLLKKLKPFQRIIYFGTGNFFMWTHAKVVVLYPEKTFYVLDDCLKASVDRNYGIRRYLSDQFNESDIIIICSSNLRLQDTIFNRFRNRSHILLPWRRFIPLGE